jgi:hypothetical protein
MGGVSLEEELKITVGDIQYVLIPHQEVVLVVRFGRYSADCFRTSLDLRAMGPSLLVLVYLTKPGQKIFQVCHPSRVPCQ